MSETGHSPEQPQEPWWFFVIEELGGLCLWRSRGWWGWPVALFVLAPIPLTLAAVGWFFGVWWAAAGGAFGCLTVLMIVTGFAGNTIETGYLVGMWYLALPTSILLGWLCGCL